MSKRDLQQHDRLQSMQCTMCFAAQLFTKTVDNMRNSSDTPNAHLWTQSSSLQDKNTALKDAGAFVPESFEGFEGLIKESYDKLVQEGVIQPKPDADVKAVPLDLEAAKKAGKVHLQIMSMSSTTLVEIMTGIHLQLCS